ncbi:YfhO family protein [Conexibacter stalactiti]|uniref:YfhO family protein n=1 Tax=Conexibacter stalactiti TaxID=1940611 RepID=A0ABU4HS88_9ACTN|nr:YfhO family protein [Conexibacter stalactiti]MDW5596156.1 YfhO family protein [Conexibacter stalactiti]MEC5036798.1 YfhO family protein [Conexibacter stalactiti]
MSRSRNRNRAQRQASTAPSTTTERPSAAESLRSRLGDARLDGARARLQPLTRLLARHPHASAAALFGLFVLIYLWPVLVGGGMLAPLHWLQTVTPWQAGAPLDAADRGNWLLMDIGSSHYPWNAFARDAIRDGNFPAWNPHVFAGVPFFSNPQTVVLSPFSVPLWILPLNGALGVSAALKLWAAGFGTYLLVRELRLGWLPGMLAGVAFALCSFNVVWLSHETLPGVAVMLPWMLWLIERVLRRGFGPALLGLALVTAVAVVGGHPGTQVHVLVAAGLYALLRGATLGGVEPRARAVRSALAVGGLALGGLLVAVLLVPELLSSRGTLGTVARAGGHGGQPGVDMPSAAIRTTLFPDWWGRPNAVDFDIVPGSALTPSDPESFFANYNERTFYAGVIALLLALLALTSTVAWRRKLPFAVLGLLALAIPLDAPLLGPLADALPVLEFIQNQRVHFVFELAVAVLAGFGLHALLTEPEMERWRLGVPLGFAALIAILAFSDLGPSGADVDEALSSIFSGATLETPTGAALAAVGWFAIFALALALALLAWHRWPQRRVAIATALVLVTALDMLHFAHGYQPMDPASEVMPPSTPAVEYAVAQRDEGRFIGLDGALPADWSMLYGLDDVRGYDPPQPTLRYYRLWLEAAPDQLNWSQFNVGDMTPAALRVLSVLGVRTVMAAPDYHLTDDVVAIRALRRVYGGRDATIFENTAALPRTLVATRLTVTPNEAFTRTRITEGAATADGAVVVERDEPGIAQLARGQLGRGSARIVEDEGSRVTIAASLDDDGLVVLNDQLTDGWSVRVDGRAAEVVRVNDVMRGVVVGSGDHEIEWSYAVPGLSTGLLLSLVGWLTLLGLGILFVVRRVRRSPTRD